MKNNRKRKKKMASKKIREKKLKQKQKYQALRPVHDQKKKCDNLVLVLRSTVTFLLIGIGIVIILFYFSFSCLNFYSWKSDFITIKSISSDTSFGKTTYRISAMDRLYNFKNTQNLDHDLFSKKVKDGSSIKIQYHKTLFLYYINTLESGNIVFATPKDALQAHLGHFRIFLFIIGVWSYILLMTYIFSYRKNKVNYQKECQKYVTLQKEYKNRYNEIYGLPTTQIEKPKK